ncbi:hypothetical protein N7470_003553 [Penicillium chermesinum]|nr:hypothetical protein N7470_003553 [Penicillium chermesinum]
MTDRVVPARAHKPLEATSPAPLTLRCPHDPCDAKFRNHEDIQKHMYEDLAHPFCSRCKIQFENKATYFEHRLKSPNHFLCPVCTTDFQSHTGRNYHMQKTHAPEQQLECQGCKAVFPSASSMMQHVEAGNCKGISLTRLVMEQNRRQNVHTLLETDPRNFKGNSSAPVQLAIEDNKVTPGTSTQVVGETSALKDITSSNPASSENNTRSSQENAPKESTPKTNNAKVATTPKTGTPSQDSPPKHLTNDTSKPVENTPDAPEEEKPPSPPVQCNDLISFDDDEAPQELTKYEPLLASNSAIPSKKDNLALQPSQPAATSLPEPPSMDPIKIDPDKYHNSLTQQYTCVCGFTTHAREHFVNHIAEERRWAIPVSGTSALLAHMEKARGRCSISSRGVFGRAVDDATGGLLGVVSSEAGDPVLLGRQLEGMQISPAPLEMRAQVQAMDAGVAEEGEAGLQRLKSLFKESFEAEGDRMKARDMGNW